MMQDRKPVTRVKPALIVIAALLALGVAPAAQAKSSATKFPYTYVNPDGSKTIIPSEPKRVVLTAQSLQELDTVVSLGVHPVGALGRPDLAGTDTNGFPRWLNGGELKGIANIGNVQPDFERVAALHPDLIITYSSFPPAQTAQLQAIAPTVQVYPGVNGPNQYPFQNTLLPIAPIFNATGRAYQLLERLNDREAALSGLVKGTSLAIILPQNAQNMVQLTNGPSAHCSRRLA